MEDIEMPAVLDSHRPRLEGALSAAEDDAQRVQVLRSDLELACEYGARLWRQLDVVRHGLVDALPDPAAGDDPHRFLAAPRGPDDDAGWDAWKHVYAGVTSALAGPTGDDGFGRHEAAQEALRRRGVFHADDRTAALAERAAAAAAVVESERSAGRVVEPFALDLADGPVQSPTPSTRSSRAPRPARSTLAVVAAAAGAVAGGLGFVAGRRGTAGSGSRKVKHA